VRGERRFLERALDAPQRLALRLPLPENARIVVRGSFGFLKQVLRSRALELRRARPRA
jgi:hypothetical protein